MAKEYSAKLTLQDNWNQVIDKAITKTSKLLKEAQKLDKMKVNPEVSIKTNKVLMKRVQDDLKKLEKNNVNIKTKLDSSFRSTVNAIQRAVPNKKVVSIEAKENVTKTLNNVEREVFTKTNKVNNILKGSMKGISSSVNDSLSPLGRMLNRMTAISNAGRLIRSGLSKASGSLLPALAGGAISGKVAGSKNKTSKASSPKASNSNFKSVLDNMYATSSKMKGIFGLAFQDVVKRAQNKLKGIITAKDIADELNEGFRGGFRGIWEFGSNFNKMIVRQKKELRRLGVKNPLSHYRNILIPDDNGESTTVLAKMPSRTSKAIADMRRKFDSLWVSIKNGARTASNVVVSTLNKAFAKIKTSTLYTKVSSVFNKVSTLATRTGTRIAFAFQRGTYQSFAAISKIIVTASRVTSSVASAFQKLSNKIPAPVRKAIDKINTSIKKIAGKTFSFTVKAIDKASSVMKGISSKAAGIAKVGMAGLLGAGTAGATVGVSGMANREKQLVSIEHFMDVADKKNNGGTNSMTREQLNGNANDYMKDLINLANATPFETQDIAAAGARAIQMTNGSAEQAMDITKLAADMAALSPGKTTQDAMEALYDLRMTGEATRLQEFGLKVNKAQMNALVGKGETDDLNEEEMAQAFRKLVDGPLKKTFSGGAEELSQTVGGKFSTVTGKLKSGLADVAMAFAPQMSASLDTVIKKMDSLFAKDENGNFTNGFVNGIIDGINAAIEFVGKLAKSFKTLMSKISSALEPIKGVFDNVFGNVSMDDVVGKITEILGKIIDFARPILEAFARMFETLAPKIMPVIDKILDAFVVVAPAFATVVDMITPVLDFFIDIFGKVEGFISEHSESINKVVESIGAIWTVVWDLISGAVDAAWKFIEPILGWLIDKLGWVAEKITSVMDTIGKWDIGGKVSHMFSPSEWKMLGGDGYTNDKKADGSHATGLQYVPDNGYRAILHRGEAVLTRQEADRYRAGQSNNNRNMNVTINVTGSDNPEKVAQVVYNKLMETANNMA